MQTLIEQIKAWGLARGITGPNGKGTLLGQLAKTQEELTETRDAAVRMEERCVGLATNELMDGIGDTTVTLILAAEMINEALVFCALKASNVDSLLGMLSQAQTALTEARDQSINNSWTAPGFDDDVAESLQHVLNCMILAADIAGMTMESCLQAAYDEIKGRTGRMEGGVFVKDTP